MDQEVLSFNALSCLYEGDYKKLKSVLEKSQTWAKAWQENKTKAVDPEKELLKLQKNDISLTLYESESYPKLLKEIASPPLGLYVLGDLSYEEPALAIVGTRAATPQGKELAYAFAKDCASRGITIISGLALGVDEYAHKGALDGGGKTIAVLGTPANYIYPKHNEKLANNILKNSGAIISEFPLNHEYFPANFLIRNRIISGLSNAILVIEAPEKSGSLATAKFALEQNREVMVLPGNVKSPNYRGSNELIKAGATVITELEDILNYFQITTKSPVELPKSDFHPILTALSKGPLSTDELIQKTALPIMELNKDLAVFSIKGIIKELNGKYHLN